MFVSYSKTIEHLKGTAEYGLHVDPPKLAEYSQQHQLIKVAESNIHPGHMFAYEQLNWWNSLKLNERVIDQIDKFRKDKVGMVRHIKQFHQNREKKEREEEHARMESLSPMRKKMMMLEM